MEPLLVPPPSKKQRVPRPVVQPPSVPDGWDRCHAYMERKGRFCRQEVLPSLALSGQFYCGNHRHLLNSSTLSSNGTAVLSTTNTLLLQVGNDQDKGVLRKRIPCPIDPTHHIYEDMLDKHIEKCPKTMEQRKQRQQKFYCHNCNCGGHGRLTSSSSSSSSRTTTEERVTAPTSASDGNTELEWAKRVAIAILETYHRLFPIPSIVLSETSNVTQITREEICDSSPNKSNTSIPLMDLSAPEFEAGFRSAITEYRIKSGGPRHIHQQASMIGHLRRIGVMEPLCRSISSDGAATNSQNETNTGEITSSTENDDVQENNQTTVRTILEMGAGRGMTGLVMAGVSAVHHPKIQTHLTMIERSASRSRAEKFLRKVQQYETSFPTTTQYMNLSHVQWNRIQCDLSHVNIETALLSTMGGPMDDANDGQQGTRRHDLVIVAKHLCGVGTDLALKSLEPIRQSVTAVIMSTCCHGVCNWNDYVGRDYLLKAILNHNDTTVTTSSNLLTFGNDEFDLLRLWSSGTVRDTNIVDTAKDTGSTEVADTDSDRDDLDDDVHPTSPNEILNDSSSTNDRSNINVTKVVEALNLKCGVQGLGRACQRLIDYGRGEYLRHVILSSENHHHDSNDDTTQTTNNTTSTTNLNVQSNNSKVELIYYVPESVTPQNALLLAYRL